MKIFLIAVLCLFIAGCSREQKPAEEAKKPAKAEKAPDLFKVKFETSKGDVVMEIHRDWAPRGADRFYELVEDKFYDDARFFRVLPKFVVQFGIHKNPDTQKLWRTLQMVDDPVKMKNTRGTVTYAMRGPNTRTTQIFINLADNTRLDSTGFAPFGKVVEGMDVVEQFFKVYGEIAPRGGGPDPNKIEAMGNEYLERSFPRLDYVKTARVVQ